jgi:hypothetical protein
MHLIAMLSCWAMASTPTVLDLIIPRPRVGERYDTLKEVLVSDSAKLVLQYAPIESRQ